MNRAATVPLAFLALVALTACQPQDATTSGADHTTTASAPGPTITCTPEYQGGAGGSGISRSGSTLTATVSLDCNQAPGPFFPVNLALFYQPTPGAGSTTYGSTSTSGYLVQYTTTATCRPGLWYVGLAVNGAPARGPQITITSCA